MLRCGRNCSAESNGPTAKVIMTEAAGFFVLRSDGNTRQVKSMEKTMLKFIENAARTLVILGLMLVTAAAVAQGAAQYPSKPIRVILPYAPGGSTTGVTRIYTQKLTEVWGQSVIVDNRPGGNTIIGSEAMVRSPNDGYTLLTVTNTHVINPLLIKTMPYDTLKDFAAISTLTRSDYMIGIHPSVPARNLKELIALAKAKPGSLNSATVGTGTVQHLVHELFCITAGVKITHVPYKGGGPAMTDLIGGQVQMSMNNLVNLAPHVKSGKVRAIAVSGDTRNPLLPDMPTFTEAGLPGYVANNWFGMLAPAGTPKDILEKVAAEIRKAQGSADVKEQLAKQGVDPLASTPAQFEALIRSDMERYAKVIKTANIKVEE